MEQNPITLTQDGVRAYATITDYEEFFANQEALIMQILREVEKAGDDVGSNGAHRVRANRR